jgi:hypothetical protein
MRRWSTALGVDDPEKARELVERARTLAEEDAKRKAADLSEVDRAKAERDQAVADAERVRGELEELKEQRLHDQQDVLLRGLAGQHVAADAIDYARWKWRTHVLSLDEAEQVKLTERDAKKFFARFAVENPKYALQAEAPAPADGAAPPRPATTAAPRPPARPAPRPVAPPARPSPTRAPAPPGGTVRRPASNGAPPPTRQEQSAGADTDPTMHNGKTTKPGLPNSMTRQELKAFATSKGLNYPS